MRDYYQELKNLGLNDEQIEGLMVFVQGQVAEEVYRQAVGAFTMEELKEMERIQINTDKRQMSTDAGGDRGDHKGRNYIFADGDGGSESYTNADADPDPDARGAKLFHSRGGRVAAGMEFVEKAYFEKTNKTMKELADGILVDYLERFLEMIKNLQAGMKKVAGAFPKELEELKKAMEKRDVKGMKEIIDKILRY